MARKIRNGGKKDALDGLRVQLIAITETSISTTSRSQKVREMVAHIILLAYKRGRPAKMDKDIENAA